MTGNDPFLQEKSTAFDQLLAVLAGRMGRLPLVLITDFRDIDSQAMQHGAQRESCALFTAALAHLRAGAPGQKPGSMAGALTKASLRSSAIAAALGVLAPRFEEIPHDVTYSSGREAAFYLARRLVDAAEGDMMKSVQIIRTRIHGGDLAAAFGHFIDPDMARIMEELGRDPARNDSGTTPVDLARFKKHMMLSFDALVSAYSDACTQLRQDIRRLSTPSSGGQKPPQP